ncbi:MAG: DUF2271 domain-containing protein [Pedobacter sp.]|nr:MAG: DUF2271 domain-containing protein [Pedobacter sp.]
MKIFASILTGLILLSNSTETKIDREEREVYVSYYENVLGTSLELKFISPTENDAEKAEIEAINEIKRLSSIFSAYDSESEFSLWMRAELNRPKIVSRELYNMLYLFQEWRDKTSGALNSSAAIAGNLWQKSAELKRLPTKTEIAKAVSQMAHRQYVLDSTNMTATRISDNPIVMNSFAKSYIINAACNAALKNSKVSGAVVNIGGDLVIKGDVDDRVNVTNPVSNAENDAPLDQLILNNKAIATSGNYRRGVQIGEKWYSHIIDPRSGKPVDDVISATVIAENATDAGALATAFNVLSLEESRNLAEQFTDVEYLIVTKSGKKLRSAGWMKFVNRPKEDVKTKTPINQRGEKPWDPKYELLISLELNVISGNTHRPFAAIWVENEKRQSVRNLALWYNKTKWLPDLRNWYRINGERFKANKESYTSVTGATRSPGKYAIKWDGKDDNGNYVPQGKYTIHIESAKEQGTDEIIRQPLELKKTALKVTQAGNVEVSNVSFEFRKK